MHPRRRGMFENSVAKLLENRFLIFLVMLTVAALALRYWGIDAHGVTYPEFYVPGIDLIDGISEPPPRHDLAFAF